MSKGLKVGPCSGDAIWNSLTEARVSMRKEEFGEERFDQTMVTFKAWETLPWREKRRW